MKDTLRRTPSRSLKDTLRRTPSRSGIRDILRPSNRNRAISAPLPRSTMPSSNQRFELPVLGPLDSLTKGTDIPPPPDSPIAEQAPALPAKDASTQPADPVSPNSKISDNENRSPNSNNLEPPVSPTSTKPSSVRRFLSRKSLNQSYANGNHSIESFSNHRPESPATITGKSGLRRMSGGSWLKRLVRGSSKDRSATGKRTSTVFESLVEQENGDQSPPAKRQNGGLNGNSNGNLGRKVDMGPPPPKLPELHQLKAKVDESTGSLGGADMFANIGK